VRGGSEGGEGDGSGVPEHCLFPVGHFRNAVKRNDKLKKCRKAGEGRKEGGKEKKGKRKSLSFIRHFEYSHPGHLREGRGRRERKVRRKREK